jgi:DNA (cytosine-5)-methyltransferase 1
MIVDLYAGPGGWSEALRLLGIPGEVGIEWDAAACATRAAAGFATIRADIGTYPTAPFAGKVRGLIGSPPCPAFSAAGRGHGRDVLPEIVEAIHRRDWTARPDPDPEVWLVIDLGRWLEDLDPEWIALEQVPAVLPVWRAYAHLLEARGYSVWTGLLNAADYGVPQTRRRAILVASRTSVVSAPPATHARTPTPTLFGELLPWVTMAQALGWTGPARVGFPRLDDLGTSPDGYRERDWRDAHTEPAGVLTEKARSWMIVTGTTTERADGLHQYERTVERPAPVLTSQSRSWTFERPSTTILGAPRISAPGHHDPNESGSQFGEGSVRLEIAEALLLQSFPADYPLRGTRTKQFEQVGNAIPPGLAAAVLAVVTK